MQVSEKNRPTILACNPAAMRHGVRPGQSVNVALALVPGLELAERDIAREVSVLRALASWAICFTPAVSIDAPDALLLDVRASLRFFGGLGRLRALLADELGARGHRFVMACAPTALASLWLARAGRGLVVHQCAELPGRLSDLPLESLGWPADLRHTLAGMGVETVGECIRLPRQGLARRLGPARLAELDRAFGARPETRLFHRPSRQFEQSLELPAETTHAGLLLAALRELLEELEKVLRRHQAAVQVLWVSLHYVQRAAAVERLGLLHASADTAYLLELARIRFADRRLDAPIIAVTLRTSLTQPVHHPGRDLLGGHAGHDDEVWTLLEQLRMRLGTEAVYGLRPVPEHRPEAAWRPVVFSGHAAICQEPSDTVIAGLGHAPVSGRPVWILQEARALRSPGGRPLCEGSLQLEGGPERIETGWWDGRDVRRDYYVARNAQGARLWVYRDCRRSRWYLHGLFG